MKDSFIQKQHGAFKTVAIVAGIAVYVSMLGYTAYHNISLMLRGVVGDGWVIAIVGIVALEITALFLPLALHFWTLDPLHRIVAFSFYGIDFLMIMMNTLVNFSTQSKQSLAGWEEAYLAWVVPITPIVAGLGWAGLLMLDPQSRVRARALQNDLQSRIYYLAAKNEYAEQDAQYRAMVESKAYRDQLEEGRRMFGIKEGEELARPNLLTGSTVPAAKGGRQQAKTNFISSNWHSLNSQANQPKLKIVTPKDRER